MRERSGRTLPNIAGGREPLREYPTENREPKGLKRLSFIVRRSSSRCNRRSKPMTKPMQHSYLLRLWRGHAGAPMRATLIAVECPDKPRHFASMDELFASLIAQDYSVVLVDDRPEWD